MRSSIVISIAALAGSALAAPSYPAAYPGDQPAANPNVEVVVEHVVHTVYVTEGSPEATPCPSSTPATPAPAVTPAPEPYPAEQPAPAPEAYPVEQPAPAPSSVVYVEATPSPYPEAPVETPEPEPEPTPTPTPTPTPSPAPAPSDGGYMFYVDKWRAKLGLSKLEFSAHLESNAHQVVVDGNGVMKHELLAETFAQVLAPGEPDKFEIALVGGWICERPNLPGLDGACDTFSKGWDYQQQTGHVDILISASYSKIGCANYKGIWCCDLA